VHIRWRLRQCPGEFHPVAGAFFLHRRDATASAASMASGATGGMPAFVGCVCEKATVALSETDAIGQAKLGATFLAVQVRLIRRSGAGVA
jgi:hypothetical protein